MCEFTFLAWWEFHACVCILIRSGQSEDIPVAELHLCWRLWRLDHLSFIGIFPFSIDVFIIGYLCISFQSHYSDHCCILFSSFMNYYYNNVLFRCIILWLICVCDLYWFSFYIYIYNPINDSYFELFKSSCVDYFRFKWSKHTGRYIWYQSFGFSIKA